MLVDSLHCNVVFNQVEILVNAMLKQEQYFLKNYASVSDDPIYHSLTDKVNLETCNLARAMNDNDVDGVFSSKITLVDDTMDIRLLSESLTGRFKEKVHIESRNDTQLVVYTTEENQTEAQSLLYKCNRHTGIISHMNMLQRTKRPYIKDLHSWRDAHAMKSKLIAINQWKEAS
tara:strand:+ start:715 stop:1236 length:522 start_codon:yes stop_codon:yes gene_type:complete